MKPCGTYDSIKEGILSKPYFGMQPQGIIEFDVSCSVSDYAQQEVALFDACTGVLLLNQYILLQSTNYIFVSELNSVLLYP
jgi:hypothetical protein